MKLDLNFLLEPPDYSTQAILTIDALAPLSMVTSMPGKYYRSQPEPTDAMLYGLLENALGWHIGEKERGELRGQLEKKHSKAVESGVGFVSLLQFHLRFTSHYQPALLQYDDYWSRHQRSTGTNLLGGSREYDSRLIPLMNSFVAKRVTIDDKAAAKRDTNLINSFSDGDKIHLDVVRQHFPRYSVSPTPRGYVVPHSPYKYVVETSEEMAQMICKAVESPAAPLYLGSNDGWVELTWEIL